jgi:hypothetical protein
MARLDQMRLLFARQVYLSGEGVNGANGMSDMAGKAAMGSGRAERE